MREGGKNLSFKYHALMRRRDASEIRDELFQSCHHHAALHVHVELGAGCEFESDLNHCEMRMLRIGA